MNGANESNCANCELPLVTLETANGAVPLLATAMVRVDDWPTATEPKSTLNGMPITGAPAAVAVPLAVTCTDGLAGSFDEIVMVPATAPTAVGVNRNVIVCDCPACSVKGGAESTGANKGFELDRAVIFSAAVPVFRTVNVRVLDCPRLTAPKSRLNGVISITGAGVGAEPATATVSPGWLAAVPTVTITGCGPVVSPAGTSTFTCKLPATRFGAAPAYRTVAALPPIVTLNGSTGLGNTVAFTTPLATAGVTAPSPVP